MFVGQSGSVTLAETLRGGCGLTWLQGGLTPAAPGSLGSVSRYYASGMDATLLQGATLHPRSCLCAWAPHLPTNGSLGGSLLQAAWPWGGGLHDAPPPVAQFIKRTPASGLGVPEQWEPQRQGWGQEMGTLWETKGEQGGAGEG